MDSKYKYQKDQRMSMQSAMVHSPKKAQTGEQHPQYESGERYCAPFCHHKVHAD